MMSETESEQDRELDQGHDQALMEQAAEGAWRWSRTTRWTRITTFGSRKTSSQPNVTR